MSSAHKDIEASIRAVERETKLTPEMLRELRARDSAVNAIQICAAIIQLIIYSVFLLGGITVFGIGIWLVTSETDHNSDRYKGGIAAIVLGGTEVLGIVIVILTLCCSGMAACCAYYAEKNSSKPTEAKPTEPKSSEPKSADIV